MPVTGMYAGYTAYHRSMDTIIYLCEKRGIDRAELVKKSNQGYLLLKLSLPFSMVRGLEDLERPRRGTGREPDSPSLQKSAYHCLLHPVGALRKRRETRRLRRKYRQEQEQWRRQLQQLQEEVLSRATSPYDSYLVYEGRVKTLQENSALWREYFALSEFRGWREKEWVERLLPFAGNAHYLVLGYGDCLGGILFRLARKMKSLEWFAEDSRYGDQVQEIAEELCEEYGLAVALTLLKEGEGYKKIRPSAYAPVTVLDFSGEARISPPLAKGSIWLDVDSLEEKEERLGRAGGDVRYFSLKKLWRGVP